MSHEFLKNNLKVLRARYDLTQEKLAEKIEVSRVTINCIERGKWIPSTVLALKMARYFGIPVEEIFYLDIKKKEKNRGVE